MEACVAERLTPQTPDLEVRDSSLARCVVSLDKELYFTLSLFTQGPVPERPISANRRLKFCFSFCIYLPMHCLE